MSGPYAAGGPAPGRRPRSRWLPLALVVAFVVMPVLEIWVILQVGAVIGGWWTVVLLVLDSLVGAWLVRHEGARAWRALQDALHRGAMPGREIADGALVLIGGTLMLTPGFVTDALGVLLVLPLTRPLFRRALAQVVSRRLVASGPAGFGGFGQGGFGQGGFGQGGFGQGGFGPAGFGQPGGGPARPPRASDDSVVRGEVVDDHDPPES